MTIPWDRLLATARTLYAVPPSGFSSIRISVYGAFTGMFDVLIMDEASKTTFQEFLVPALHAGRWIIAGDTKQLAPHTEQAEIGTHMDRCVDERLGQVCHNVFTAARRRCMTAIAVEDRALKETYQSTVQKAGGRVC